MSTPMEFRLRGGLADYLDLSALTPANLAGKTRQEIERMALLHGNEKLALADLFQVSGDDPHHLIFAGGSPKFFRLGAHLEGGHICVEGPAGHEAGFGMLSGRLDIHGDAGHFTGCEMRGGELYVGCDVGDFLGAALPGNMQGMRGGCIHVKGSTGDRVADRMRRGLVLIEGHTGDYLGARMLAGTVIVGGNVGRDPGLGLKRGSIVLMSAQPATPSFFNDCGVHEMPFLSLLRREIRQQPDRVHFAALPGLVRRWCGDLGEGAYGEILLCRD